MSGALAALVLVVSSLLVAPRPTSAATLAALPATVRVNIAGLGTTYALLSSTGTISVTRADGTLLYSGGARALARRNVHRVEGADLPDRRAAADPDERRERLALLREARNAQREGDTRALVTIPFEVSLLQSSSDDLGTPLVTSSRIERIRLTTEGGLLSFNGRPYHGSFELTADDEGDLIVVNTVSTHDYLASVVGSEVPSTWEPEALAAQAIAARTYLLTHLGRHGSYDLEGDTRDQEYDGIGGETTSTIRAAERTAGLIATYRGGAIEALYSANAGGITEDSENVFANALPYLRSVPSPEDEVASRSSFGRTSWQWTREITAPQLRDYLIARGINVGEPTRIDLTRLAPSGRVLAARIVGTVGQREIGKDAGRYYFGLRSSLFTVQIEPGGDDEAVEYSNAERVLTLAILGARRVGTVYRPGRGDELFIVGSVHRLPPRFVFSGRGFGHGVGLSQWGAQGMALGGASAEQILKHYYQGIALTQIGGD